MKHIALVGIKKNGADVALFLDGELILSADPSAGDDVRVVHQLANRLTHHYMVKLNVIEHMPEADWNWDEVKYELVSKQDLPSAELCNRSDIQFCRIVNTINAMDNPSSTIKHICKETDLTKRQVNALLKQAGETMIRINSSIF